MHKPTIPTFSGTTPELTPAPAVKAPRTTPKEPGRERFAVQAAVVATTVPPDTLITIKEDEVLVDAEPTNMMLVAALAADLGAQLHARKGLVAAWRTVGDFQKWTSLLCGKDPTARLILGAMQRSGDHVPMFSGWMCCLVGIDIYDRAPRIVHDAAYGKTYRAETLHEELANVSIREANYFTKKLELNDELKGFWKGKRHQVKWPGMTYAPLYGKEVST